MQSARGSTKQRAGALMVTAAAAIAIALVAFTGLGGSQPAPSSPPKGSPSFATPTRPPAGSVFVYYEVLDADGALLYERVLDGTSLPRLIVERPSSDFSRTYTVDPVGHAALATFAEGGETSLEAIDIATGLSRWRTPTPLLEPESGVWSADGRRWAALVAEVDFEAGPSVLIADLASGATALVALDERAWPQGFTTSGELVLTERDEDLTTPAPWHFLEVDARTGGVVRLAVPPPVGPHTSSTDDVAPAAGIGAASFFSDDGRSTIEVRDLTEGPWRRLADFEFVDRVLFAPSGDLIAASADGRVVLVDLSGNVSEVWDGPDYAELMWSASGSYLGISGYEDRSVIAVAERSTGRVVELPLPEEIAEGRLVSVVGSNPLPPNALPPGGDPQPTPSPAPTGPPVPDAPSIAVGWIALEEDVPVGHAEIRVTTEDGGVRTIATMPPITFDDLRDQEVTLSVVPRPGGPDVLVKVDSDGLTQAWLWDPSAGRRPFPFPEGWPAAVGPIAWRPDGGALASTTFDPEGNPDAVPQVVVAELDTSIVRQLPLPDEYPELLGWWSDTQLRMGSAICTEGCPGRYAYNARLRVADGQLEPVTAPDGTSGPVHQAYVEFDPEPEIVLSAVNDDPSDDVRIRWPASLPAIDGSIVLWATPRPDLLVGAPVDGAIELYRIADPVGRARAGRVAEPRPTLVARLPVSATDPLLSSDGRWLMVRDRAGGLSVIELETDRRWSLGPGRQADWRWLVNVPETP
ncbi:MAG TPA: hypothetical protein VH813_00470 [Candidatus Limnocylindrales bacterium]